MAEKVELVNIKKVSGRTLQGIDGPCLMWMEVTKDGTMAIHMPHLVISQAAVLNDMLEALELFCNQIRVEAGPKN